MRRSESEIADVLNSEGLTTDLGRPWTRGTVHQVLTNEKYIGNNVFNRVSFKLKKRRVRNPPEKLVRAVAAFEQLIDHETFQKAAEIIAERSRRYSDEEMLGGLSALLRETGTLSALVIDERDDLPSSSAYRSRFGSLLRAYELIGYQTGRDYRYVAINQFLRSLHDEQVSRTIAAIEAIGAHVVRDPDTNLLSVNGEVTASIVVARCLETSAGSLRWKIRFDTGLQPDLTIAIRMAAGNREIKDYYLLPRIDWPFTGVRVAEENGLNLDAYRTDTIDAFINLTARSRIRRAA